MTRCAACHGLAKLSALTTRTGTPDRTSEPPPTVDRRSRPGVEVEQQQVRKRVDSRTFMRSPFMTMSAPISRRMRSAILWRTKREAVDYRHTGSRAASSISAPVPPRQRHLGAVDKEWVVSAVLLGPRRCPVRLWDAMVTG